MNERKHGSAQVEPGVERLLSSLTGVLAAHIVAGPEGSLREIHILATNEIHPKQVARNVESALSAGLGIEVDRRIISVAQVCPEALETDAVTPPPMPAGRMTDARIDGGAAPIEPIRSQPDPVRGARRAPAATGTQATSRAWPRVIFLGYDARIDGSHRAACRVTLQTGREEVTGEGEGANTPRGRAEAAARAVFSALARSRADDRLGLEGVAILEANGAQYVLVAAHALDERRPIPLTGAALVDRSPEEAAIFASLQATNRWRAKI